MFIRRLKCIFLCIVMILSSTMLFSGCNAAEEISEQTTAAETLSDEELDALVKNMPDIVFVKFYWLYSHDVIAGEYIDKNGYIRDFEFREGDWLDYDYRSDPIYDVKRLYQYTEVRNVKTVNDMIIQHYKESGDNDIVKTVDMEELGKYYSDLLQVNTNKRMKAEGYSYLAVIDPWACMYGIRKNDDGISEIVFIREYETEYLTTKEKNANNLFVELGNVFSKMDVVPSYGW